MTSLDPGITLFMATSLAIIVVSFVQPKQSQAKLKTTDPTPSAYASLIGNTPLVKLHRLSAILKRDIFVKMESLNPGGTGKDRAVKWMLEHARRNHPNYKPGCVIVEGSSGSTGISLAAQVLHSCEPINIT